MNKKLIISDVNDNKKQIEIKNFENVLIIRCDIKSGDEVLVVTYEDLSEERFDSGDNRFTSICVLSEYIYIKDKLDLLDEFSNKKSSYDEID